MQRVEPEILEHLEAVIERLWTEEQRSFIEESDLNKLVGHVFRSVLALDRWLASQKQAQPKKAA